MRERGRQRQNERARGTEGKREREGGGKERRKENHFSFPFQGIICKLKLTWGVQEQWQGPENGPGLGGGGRMGGGGGGRGAYANEDDVQLFTSLSFHNIYLMQFNSSGLLAALRILLSSSQSLASLLQLLRV